MWKLSPQSKGEMGTAGGKTEKKKKTASSAAVVMETTFTQVSSSFASPSRISNGLLA